MQDVDVRAADAGAAHTDEHLAGPGLAAPSSTSERVRLLDLDRDHRATPIA